MSKSSDLTMKAETPRRTFLKNALGATAVAAASLKSASATSDLATRTSGTKPLDHVNPARLPNIVYIHSHDSGRYVEPYGVAIPTPNISQLAAEGVFFRNCFSAAPTCSPSRAALLTGMAPHNNGMLGLAHLGWSLHDYNQVIIHTLKPHGYTSILAGLQHIATKPERIGYDVLLPHKSNFAKDVAPVAADYIQGKPQQPFFLDVGFHETHRPYPSSTAADKASFLAVPDATPDNAATREDMAAFHASARSMDEGVGKVLAALEKAGLAENTLILNTTDHGIAFPDMKCSLRDDGWGVSMTMRGPGAFSQPMTCDAMISHLDVFPTICEYLGIEKPSWLQGRSFLPVLTGKSEEINDQIFAEVTYHASYEPKRTVRTHRWKYIKRFDGRTKAVLPNCDDSPSKEQLLKAGWQQMNSVKEEYLYDLVFDPEEKNNLSVDSSCRQTLVEMRERLATWMKSTD
ncbi:MAG: sulfatase, partial [Bryocella sp.]